MAEPSRKKIKGFASPAPTLQLVPNARTPPSLVLHTNHDKGSVVVDLTQFAEGTMDASRHPLIQNRFTGRPELIKQLAPHIHTVIIDKTSKTALNIIPILRKWWTFFDAWESEHSVRTVLDIDDFIGLKHYHEKDLRGNYRTDFLRIVNLARDSMGLPALYWPSSDDDGSHRDLPPFEDVKLIYHELKQDMKSVVARWDRADSLARVGTDWSGGLQKRHSRIHGYWLPAETHATYRGAISRLEVPSPTRVQFGELLQRPKAEAVLNMVDALEGLYPRHRDAQHLLYLFLLRTGWNATTAMEIDVSTCIVAHPTSEAHHIVRSIKNRGNTEQVAIGLNKSQFSPGNILRLLIERTKPLRDFLELRLQEAETAYQLSGSTSLLARVRELRRMVRTPWLFVTRKGEISYLKDTNYLAVKNGKASTSGLKLIIAKINQSRGNSKLIDEEMTVGDFRDAYISFAYETSGYSWLVAKLAAGHSSIESLRSYLRKRHWKAHGEKKVHAWGEAFWSEIKIYRTVDPAILFARVQRGEISDEERARWVKRTHVGTGCKDSKRPPDYIAPEHQKDTDCRVQRCTLCHHAILFDESYDLLARRLVELEHLHTSIALLAWMQSSFPIEMENIVRALEQYDSAKVAERKRYWEEEVKSGRYIPVTFEGTY
jgi:hypothetical protein